MVLCLSWKELCSCQSSGRLVPLSVFKSIPWLNYLMKMYGRSCEKQPSAPQQVTHEHPDTVQERHSSTWLTPPDVSISPLSGVCPPGLYRAHPGLSLLQTLARPSCSTAASLPGTRSGPSLPGPTVFQSIRLTGSNPTNNHASGSTMLQDSEVGPDGEADTLCDTAGIYRDLVFLANPTQAMGLSQTTV